MEKALARFYTKQQLNDFISKYRTAVENVKLEAAAASQEKKQAVTEPSSVVPEVAQQPSQTPQPSPKAEPVNVPSDNCRWYLLLGILILLVVIGFFVRGRRKNP